jgi:hypothetical protein
MDYKPHWKRCKDCEEKESCEAMCVDVCWDEIMWIEARKQYRRQYMLDNYQATAAMKSTDRVRRRNK